VRKVVLYIATSLDGFIATEGQDLAWLFATEGEGDNGFSAFYKTVDTVLLGRTTYDWILQQEKGRFPYQGKECFVFSRGRRGKNEFVTFVEGDIPSLVNQLKGQDGKDIWLVGGGELVSAFVNEGQIDQVRVTIAPTLLGRGIPLFPNLVGTTRLTLTEVQRFNQFVELSYGVKR